MRSVYQNKKQAYRAGLWAEWLAALYLFIHGYRILETRYKTKIGEIDLIVRRGNRIIFVEVKTRRTLEEARLSISAQARKRIKKTAALYLATHPCYQSFDCRFDMIGIILRGGFFPIKIEHLDNAWHGGA